MDFRCLMFVIISCLLGFVFVLFLFLKLNKIEKGAKKTVQLSSFIQHGANTFLMEEYKSLGAFVLIFALAL